MTATESQSTALPPLTSRPARLALLAGVGVVAGTLSGLLGVGGGLVIVPAMILVLTIPQKVAHATSLAAIVPTALAGVLIFGSSNSVDLAAGVLLAVGAMVGVQLGAVAMHRTSDARLRQAFGLFVLVIAAAMATR